MPTGYTAFIEDGEITNAKDFLMLCARAFGVAIDMREEPLSKPMPKEFKASTYHLERLEEERRELDRLRSMTMDEVHEQNEAEYQRSVAVRKEILEEKKAIKDRYIAILNDVKAWTPPTTEHNGLKEFAIEQIEMCLPDLSYYDREPVRVSDQEWIRTRIESCQKSIQRHKEGWDEECERVASRNKWLADLRGSLK